MARKGERSANFFNSEKNPVSLLVLRHLIFKHFDKGLVPHYEHEEYDSVIATMQEA